MTNFQDVLRDVHDPSIHALKTTASLSASTVYVGNPTLYAVVNTGAAGVGNSIVTIANTPLDTQILGNVTLSGSIPTGANYIGSASVNVANIARTITGNVTLSDAKTYIGLTTTTLANQPALTAGVANIGFATVSVSNPTIYAVVNTGAAGTTDVTSNSGVTVYQGGTFTVTQASAVRSLTGNLTLSDSKAYIGLVTVTQASATRSILGNVTLSDPKTFIGLVTSVPSSTTRSIIGNVTVLIAGTTKTLVTQPVAFALTSVSTIAVPTNTFKMTHLLLNSNATVGVSIKSGATYLTGNASIRVTLSPNGGWVENGSPDSPIYVGLAGASAIVVEKDNATAAVAGKVMYFDE